MSYLPNRDFLIEVQKGNVAGHSMVHKFGRNPAVANGVWELVSTLSTTGTSFRTSASTMRIKAGGNAVDTAAGGGAQEVTIQGIDDSGNEIAEAIATAGASASSATSASFWRVNRAWVSAVGTYGVANIGDVMIEDSGGAGDVNKILAAEGQTQYAGYTIPAGKTGYLLSCHLSVDASKAADFRLLSREDMLDTSAPVAARRLMKYWDGIINTATYIPRGPDTVLPALTDIWVEAEGGGAASEVSADFELLLVDD